MNKLKKIVQYALQKFFGIPNYLFCFGFYRALLKLFVPGDQLKMFIKLSQAKEGDVIDIGTNVGTNMIFYGKKMPNKQIIGFEPLPILVATSKQLIRFFRLQNCTVIPEGVGAKNDFLSFVTPYEHGVFMHGLTHVKEVTTQNDQLVPIRTLDYYYQTSGYKAIAAIKIDVENHELFVIAGASEVLSKERPYVFMEVWENARKQLVEAAMYKLDYTKMIINEGKLVIAGDTQKLDYFFIPNERVESVNL